jgi:tetratricopeptide (TPR) repeat protein
MRCLLVLTLGSVFALAQPQRGTFQEILQAHQEALGAGHYEAATATRNELRWFIETARVDSPEFADWVQQVSSIYSGLDMSRDSRAILEAALARVGKRAPAGARVKLLGLLATSWSEDRNPLKAVACLEEAAAAAKAAGVSQLQIYGQLAGLYQEIGRPDSVQSVLEKIRQMGPDSSDFLAYLYQNQGRTDDAIAAMKGRLEHVNTDPLQSAYALQHLANLLSGQNRYTEAASALTQAINGLDGPTVVGVANAMRQQLAFVLGKAGQTEAGDRMFQQTRSTQGEDPTQDAIAYANYYTQTGRKQEAEKLLQDYLESHSDLSAGREASVLFAVSNAASDDEHAQEYQKRAMEKQKAAQPESEEEQAVLLKYLEEAQGEVERDPDKAFRIALKMLDTARADPADRDVVALLCELAGQLGQHAPDKAEQLFQVLLSMAESWRADTLQPLLSVTDAYSQFQVSLGDQPEEALAAIQRHRSVLIASKGEGSGWLTDVLRLEIQVESARGAAGRALILAQDLVAMEESLSGKSSASYKEAQEVLNVESPGQPWLNRHTGKYLDLLVPYGIPLAM